MLPPSLKRLFLRTHGTPLALAWRGAYAAAVRFVAGRIIGTPGVKAVYLTSGLLDEPVYGLADIDLVVLVDDPDGYAVLRVVELAAYLKTIVPMLEPPEAIGVYAVQDLEARLAESPLLQYRLLAMPRKVLFGPDLLAGYRPTATAAAQALGELSDGWALAVRVFAEPAGPERPYQWRKILGRVARARHFARTGVLLRTRREALATVPFTEATTLAEAWPVLHRLITEALPVLAKDPPRGEATPLPIAGEADGIGISQDPLVLACETARRIDVVADPRLAPEGARFVAVGDVLYPMVPGYPLALRPLHPEAFSCAPAPAERVAALQAGLDRQRDKLRQRLRGGDPHKLTDEAWVRLCFNALGTRGFLATPADAVTLFPDDAATIHALAAWLADPARGALPRPLFHASLALARRAVGLEPDVAEPPRLRLSVVVCTRDRAAPLDRFLGRVAAQSRPADEVVVVDNGSTDGTAAVAERWSASLPVRYVFHAPPGVPGARNAGIAAAGGDVIVYADDDTEPEPAWLAALEEPFLRDPHIGVVGGEVLQARAQRGPIADFFRRYMGET